MEKRNVELIVRDIVELTGDDSPRSVRYWIDGTMKLGEQVTRRLIASTKEAAPRSGARYFTALLKKELEKIAP